MMVSAPPAKYSGRHTQSALLSAADHVSAALLWSVTDDFRRPDQASWRSRSCSSKAISVGALIIAWFSSYGT
jgi:hypothetical protein